MKSVLTLSGAGLLLCSLCVSNLSFAIIDDPVALDSSENHVSLDHSGSSDHFTEVTLPPTDGENSTASLPSLESFSDNEEEELSEESGQQPEKFIVVSDIDDTIKITAVGHYREMFFRWWYGTQTYVGMSKLFGFFSQKAKAIYYLSGSPSWFRRGIFQLLFEEDSFPLGGMFLRPVTLSGLPAIQKFKRDRLEELVRIHPDHAFIFFGDDVEKDPEILESFRIAHPEVKVLATYIHQVRSRSLQASQGIGYVASYEVALREFESDRLTRDEVIEIGNIILTEGSAARVFPMHKSCINRPYSLGEKAAAEEAIVIQASQLFGHLEELCENREIEEIQFEEAVVGTQAH